MSVRIATEGDIPEIGRVRMSVRENRLASLSSLRPGETERMLGGDGCGWVAEVDGRVVGFAIADLCGANVYALFVEPEYERQGIGRILHDTMMDWFFAKGAGNVWLSTDPGTRAEGFYRKAGWTVTGAEPNGETRFEMSRDRWLVKSGNNKLIGLISDTHGLMRPEAAKVLKDVDLILHAGDIGSFEVLQELRSIAPLVVVRGNNDKGDWADQISESEVTQVGDVYIYMLHDLNTMDLNPSAAGFHVVVSGHSHRPSVEKKGRVLFINPGSAGPRRFKLPVTVAYLRIEGAAVRGEVIELALPHKTT